MKLSTKGRYGVKAMLDIAIHSSEGQVSLKSIAERQEISENYLEQLFATLKKSGLVKSVRGAQGGYYLAGKPEEISIGSILRALEGSLAPVDCVLEENAQSCTRADNCVTKLIWEKMRDKINEAVDSISLKDLVQEYNKLNNKDNYMYYI
ncbi:Rrf2 family transcriptional regulator [Clostridium thermosuccinogenes]|jgi:Rrf2 family protein|uniref:Rrf2 family transcriptional regulator n=1 Tax=Clostridium thermosuccinogenes TaxID=84032 RepID=A0A2K2F201_9CLOT|nr:Rrf2 family transcriptional regulator [Pseudoclostridium thermosuccinogenes]AUS96535.1 Rrf2 family transcriptional regulator [Pseudoclostridium thermosuccinogenes]PNT92806.1 Rrf2 family transcriptional regulator [Pseudoclostridium thermosuccinogenes]PNT97972.1 Rrf2 family transcriptional regulator [Pseudoclostridium thermosuccinogenes]PNT99991.1 Rrf2 family transcriptional regulator [Pseudoclostridium thermosuccinogenes]